MTPVLTRHAPEPVRNLRSVAAPVALVVLLVAVFALLMQLVAAPATVDHISIRNRSALELEITIHPSGDQSSLPVAAMEARSTTTVADVLDQGDEWVFRGEHAGRRVGELQLSRRDLGNRGWNITIPAGWSERAAGGA
jgi:hypothetical protein